MGTGANTSTCEVGFLLPFVRRHFVLFWFASLLLPTMSIFVSWYLRSSSNRVLNQLGHSTGIMWVLGSFGCTMLVVCVADAPLRFKVRLAFLSLLAAPASRSCSCSPSSSGR